MTLPFSKPGTFYKGNLHTHSTLSDGSISPEQVCDFYREAGYDFLALTDHFLERYNWPIADTRPFRTKGFTTLPGAELHTGETTFGGMWHILAVGLPEDFAPAAPDETGPELAYRAMKSGAYVAVAHPAWYTLTEADITSLGQLHAIEVFNGTSVDSNDRADSWHITDIMLSQGWRYTICATDDAHFHPHRHDAGLGWVYVKARRLDPRAIVEALKRGDSYSSTGPQIHDIAFAGGNRIVVRCSPADRVYLTGQGAAARHAYGPGLREAEFSLRNFDSPYCRVTVRDAQGKRAWSNPIWL
ncbi:MAG: CehA/McbA family metallohydrolase [Anaerolineae bacterium]|nr:CehA/McbA family metallohydrolase [Anaerolineae bacterium]